MLFCVICERSKTLYSSLICSKFRSQLFLSKFF